jgi:hypothetical protein
MPSFIVKEREYAGLSKPNPYRRKRQIKYGPWKVIGTFAEPEPAVELRRHRNIGLFQRVVFYGGTIVINAEGDVYVPELGWINSERFLQMRKVGKLRINTANKGKTGSVLEAVKGPAAYHCANPMTCAPDKKDSDGKVIGCICTCENCAATGENKP